MTRSSLWRALTVLTLSATFIAPAYATGGSSHCTPTPEGLAQELNAILAAPAPITDDKVDFNSYTRANGDNDGDGVKNKYDAFPNESRDHKDTDGDGVGDNLDHFPEDPKEWFDSDCDGKGDNSDDTYDGPGIVSKASWFSSDGRYGTNVKFTIVMTPDKVAHIKLKVKLTGKRDSKREAEWEKEVEEMWSNDRMKLDLEYVSSGGDVSVHVSRGDGRTNSGHYYTGDNGATIAHETGHLLGLNDEYHDSSDRDRLIGEEDSLMRWQWNKPKVYQRHVDQILANFDCDNARKATEDDIDPSWAQASTGTGGDTSTDDTGTDTTGTHTHTHTHAHDEETEETARERAQVHPPDGTSKYLASRQSYQDSFVRVDGEDTFMVHANGEWWTWQQTLSNGSVSVVHPQTGETAEFETSELSEVVADEETVVEETVVEDTGVQEETTNETSTETGVQTDSKVRRRGLFRRWRDRRFRR